MIDWNYTSGIDVPEGAVFSVWMVSFLMGFWVMFASVGAAAFSQRDNPEHEYFLSTVLGVSILVPYWACFFNRISLGDVLNGPHMDRTRFTLYESIWYLFPWWEQVIWWGLFGVITLFCILYLYVAVTGKHSWLDSR